MSSGDESDDADLTEAGSVEEDWSESGGNYNLQEIVEEVDVKQIALQIL